MRLPSILISCLVLTSSLTAEPIRVNGIAAKANGDVITMNELMIKLAPIQSILMAQFPRRGAAYQERLKKERDAILDELINRTIIFMEYKERIDAIPDRAIEEEVQREIKTRYAGDEALFRKYLKATNLTRDQFKEQKRKDLLVQIIRQQQFPDIPPPTNDEIEEVYKKWKIANRDRKKDVGTYHKIYLRKGLDREAALQQADDIVAQLKGGANFATLAKKFSTDARAKEGGLWKDVPRTDLALEFGFAVFDTEGHEIMGPHEDQFGITIVQVVERKLGPSEPLSKVRDKMKLIVDGQKKQASFAKWMKKLRDKTPVQKMIGE